MSDSKTYTGKNVEAAVAKAAAPPQLEGILQALLSQPAAAQLLAASANGNIAGLLANLAGAAG